MDRRRLAARAPAPGVPEDSPLVHDEIRALAADVNATLRARAAFVTSAPGITAAVRLFGPSEASRAMMSLERDAAHAAQRTGLYVSFVHVEARASGRHAQCARLGPPHACYCGHTLAEHGPEAGAPQPIAPARRGGGAAAAARAGLGPCRGCPCGAFRYGPMRPEEIGDGHLSRRAGFDVAAWGRGRCACGHPAAAHAGAAAAPGSLGTCRECRRCRTFEAAYVCVVCDKRWGEHEAIAESAAERGAQGLPVGVGFAPLADDPELHSLVFGDDNNNNNNGSGGGAVAEHASDGPRLARRSTRPAVTAGPTPPALGPPAVASVGAPREADPPAHCARCATIFRAPGDTCPKCGAPRRRQR